MLDLFRSFCSYMSQLCKNHIRNAQWSGCSWYNIILFKISLSMSTRTVAMIALACCVPVVRLSTVDYRFRCRFDSSSSSLETPKRHPVHISYTSLESFVWPLTLPTVVYPPDVITPCSDCDGGSSRPMTRPQIGLPQHPVLFLLTM